MSENGTHPLKPKTEWCRRSALMRWKGWSGKVVEALVRQKFLSTKRFFPSARLYYRVASAVMLKNRLRVADVRSGKVWNWRKLRIGLAKANSMVAEMAVERAMER